MEVSLRTQNQYIYETINNGVSVELLITLNDEFAFDAIFWKNEKGEKILEIEDNFLKIFGVSRIEDLPFLNELYQDIEFIIPPDKELFKWLK
jgi:hypothetical protein